MGAGVGANTDLFGGALTCANPELAGFVHNRPDNGGAHMFDAQTAALLRTILDEVCAGMSGDEAATRAHVASKLFESANRGEISVEGLKAVARKALSDAPTMWR